MATAGDTVDKATCSILAADLTPIEHQILVGFIKEAEDPDRAARKVLSRICDDARPTEETLRILKKDWYDLVAVISRVTPLDAPLKALVDRRDQSRCCVTPPDRQQLDAPEPAFIIPLALLELENSSNSLLDAFMTPSRAARLRSMILDTSDAGRLSNAWLLTPSILHALQNGHLQVRFRGARNWNTLDEDAATDDLKAEYFMMPTYPEVYKDIVLADRSSFHAHRFPGIVALQTEDPKLLPLINPFLLKTHCKFANALHQFYVEERIAEGWGPVVSPSYLSRNMQLFSRAIWLLVPKFILVACYRRLLNKGKSKYGLDISEVVQQLPLGLYAKRCDRTEDNEPHALRLLEEQAPSIPGPLLIDTFRDSDVDWFIMTRLPGTRLESVLHRTSYAERDQLAADLSHILSQMHKIRNTTPYLFASSTGGPVYDRRLGYDNTGPFNSEADLNARIACGIQAHLTTQVPTAFSRSHASVFTHGDLFVCNLLVDGGRLSGIVDWEGACFMPEYWEFTKAMRTARSEEAKGIYRAVWGDRFEVELETERFLWNAFPFGGEESPMPFLHHNMKTATTNSVTQNQSSLPFSFILWSREV